MSPLRFFITVLVVIATLAGAAGVGLVAYGRETLWEELAGPPDMGPYDFDMPTRTGKINDALFCPTDDAGCERGAPERLTPVFRASGADLYAAVRAMVTAMPGATVVEDQAEALSFRAVVRSPLLRLPDTVSVHVEDVRPGEATLWMYSRSQIGHADLGANSRRLRAILRALRDRFEVSAVPPA